MSAVNLSSQGGPEQLPPPLSHLGAPARDHTLFEGKRAIIVEDEGITQIQLQKMLQRAGFTIVGSASTGKEAVALCLREQPDLVLMDVNMPGEINGIEAARLILTQYHTCIVMVTAYTHFKEEAELIGVCGYIVKPIDSLHLLPQLEAAFRRFYRR